MQRRLAMLSLALVLAAVPFTLDAGRAAAGTPTATHEAKASAAMNAATKVDINSASKEDLAKLPVIGDAIADKIVAGRPYATKRDLLTRKILTAKQYAKIKDMIIAKK